MSERQPARSGKDYQNRAGFVFIAPCAATIAMAWMVTCGEVGLVGRAAAPGILEILRL